MDAASEKALIRTFQRRRVIALLGVVALAGSILFGMLDYRHGFMTGMVAWPLGLGGVAFSVFAYRQYRCPFCGEYPEDDDVFLYDPKQCAACGKHLKRLD